MRIRRGRATVIDSWPRPRSRESDPLAPGLNSNAGREIPGSLTALPCRLWLALLVLFAATPLPAWAHREKSSRSSAPEGISIPSLSHGQMQVIAANLSAIRDLAERQDPTDLTMRRLQDFVNLQAFACLWGMVPGSLTDEASPFNECAHSYLAGAQALLLHLQQMSGGDRRGVNALVNKIELEMLSNNASLILCRYSDEPFNTDEVISPHWSKIPLHLPSLMTFAAIVSLIAAATILPLRRAGP